MRHYETIWGSKKDAQRRLAELQVEVEKDAYIKPKKRITLGEWFDEWLNGYVKTNCSPRTLDGYRSILGHHVIPILDMIPLAQLQPQHIQQYYAQALSDGRTDGKGALSSRSVLHIHRVVFQALNYAVRQGLLIHNPAQFVDPPRAKRPKMKILTPEEIARLFSVVEHTPYYPIIYTAVKTGLRQAELLGLRWRDLDLDLASLSVTQVLYKRRGICQFKEPKSAHSQRRLDWPPSLALFLWQYRIKREAECLLLGRPLSENDLVFTKANGSPRDPGTLTHSFARIARRAGLPGTRFLDLRHTFASLMLLAGIHPKIVSEMLEPKLTEARNVGKMLIKVDGVGKKQ